MSDLVCFQNLFLILGFKEAELSSVGFRNKISHKFVFMFTQATAPSER